MKIIGIFATLFLMSTISYAGTWSHGIHEGLARDIRERFDDKPNIQILEKTADDNARLLCDPGQPIQRISTYIVKERSVGPSYAYLILTEVKAYYGCGLYNSDH